jgi:hypothetical protein
MVTHKSPNFGITPNNLRSVADWSTMREARKSIRSVYVRAKKEIASSLERASGQNRFNSDNALDVTYPEVAQEWHPRKNGPWTPDQFTYGGKSRMWWQCQTRREHVWKAAIVSRTLGKTGCPYCAGKKVCSTNSLARVYSEIASEWHPGKNGELAPTNVTAHSQKMVWWRCANRHDWQARIGDRTGNGRGCPYLS